MREAWGQIFRSGKRKEPMRSWVIPSPKTTINLPSCFGAENNSNVIGISQQERTKNMPSHIQKSMQQYVCVLPHAYVPVDPLQEMWYLKRYHLQGMIVNLDKDLLHFFLCRRNKATTWDTAHEAGEGACTILRVCGYLAGPDIEMLCTVGICRSGEGGVHYCEEIRAGRVSSPTPSLSGVLCVY